MLTAGRQRRLLSSGKSERDTKTCELTSAGIWLMFWRQTCGTGQQRTWKKSLWHSRLLGRKEPCVCVLCLFHCIRPRSLQVFFSRRVSVTWLDHGKARTCQQHEHSHCCTQRSVNKKCVCVCPEAGRKRWSKRVVAVGSSPPRRAFNLFNTHLSIDEPWLTTGRSHTHTQQLCVWSERIHPVYEVDSFTCRMHNTSPSKGENISVSDRLRRGDSVWIALCSPAPQPLSPGSPTLQRPHLDAWAESS